MRSCVCREPDDGWMIGCDTCDVWYHYGCAGITKKIAETLDNKEWHCPLCRRFNASESKMMSKIRTLEQHCQDLNAKFDEVVKLTAEQNDAGRCNLDLACKDLSAEKNKLKGDYEELIEKFNKLVETCQQKDSERSLLDAAFKDLSAENIKLNVAQKELNDKFDKLVETAQQKDAERNILDAALKDLSAENVAYKELNEKFNKLVETCQQKDAERSILDTAFKNLSTENNNLKVSYEELIEKFNNLVKESKQKDDDNRNLDVAYKKLNKLYKQGLQVKEEREAEILRLNGDNKKLRKKLEMTSPSLIKKQAVTKTPSTSQSSVNNKRSLSLGDGAFSQTKRLKKYVDDDSN